MHKNIPYEESLEYCYPNLVKEWHPIKNGTLLPHDIPYKSVTKVWWYLPYDDPITGKHFDFEWESSLRTRTMLGINCPFITGHAVWRGYNDLETLYPQFAAEWHPIKNGNLKPYEVVAKSNKKVWWYLPYDDLITGKHFDFEWESSINNRVGQNLGCPYLSSKSLWSGFNDLLTRRPDVASEWHPSKNGDLTPSDVTCYSHKKVWWYLPYDDLITGKHFDFEWECSIAKRTLRNFKCPYLSGHAVWRGYNDLETLYPQLAAEWHPTKNGDLKPCEVTTKTAKKVWWYFPYDDPITGKHFDFEWEDKVVKRVAKNIGCPYLSGHAVWRGYNDLETLYPQLAAEWHSTKNGKLKPFEVYCRSFKKYWWFLRYSDEESGNVFNFEWKCSVFSRIQSNFKCPYISGYAVWRGYNDLETWFPEIAAEWHPTKNRNKKPYMYAKFSGKKIWWKCKNNHEWRASIYNRTYLGSNCPICAIE